MTIKDEILLRLHLYFFPSINVESNVKEVQEEFQKRFGMPDNMLPCFEKISYDLQRSSKNTEGPIRNLRRRLSHLFYVNVKMVPLSDLRP